MTMVIGIKISSCAAEVDLLIAVLHVQYVCMYVCTAGVYTVVFLYYVLLKLAGPNLSVQYCCYFVNTMIP